MISRTVEPRVWPTLHRTRAALALVALLVMLAPAPLVADPILNTLTKTPPYDFGSSNGGGYGPGSANGHAVQDDGVIPGAGAMTGFGDVWVHTEWPHSAAGDVFAEAQVGVAGFDCLHTSSYRLTADVLINGMLAIVVPAAPDFWGGAEAHAQLLIRLRVTDVTDPTNEYDVLYHTINYDRLDDDYTGSPIIHTYDSHVEVLESLVFPMTAGNTYSASVYIFVRAHVAAQGNASGHAVSVFGFHDFNFGGQHYVINGVVQARSLTITDQDPDHTPPSTVFHPLISISACNPPVIGRLVTTENPDGYGLDTVYWRYHGGDWAVYTGHDFDERGDLWLQFYAVDRAGNQESMQEYIFDFLPEAPMLVAPPEPAPPLIQPAVLRWREDSDHVSHQVEVADEPTFAAPLFAATVDDPVAFLPAFAPGTTYHWRVSSFHDDCQNWSLPGEAGQFTVTDDRLWACTFGDPATYPDQFDFPYPNHDIVALAAGYGHALMIGEDGEILVWGNLGTGMADVPSPNSDFVAVSGGSAFSMGLRSDGSIAAWGYNDVGQYDPPAPNADFAAVDCGANHTLALKHDGSLVAWGQNDSGQCTLPTPNAGWVAVAGGHAHSLALRGNGEVIAWGDESQFQCDPPVPNDDFVAIAAGGYHNLALGSDGSIVAWGWNGSGQCDVPEPNTGFVAVAAGYDCSLALRADGSIEAWGNNEYGQCDIPEPNAGFYAIAAGANHTYALQDWDGVSAVAEQPEEDLPRRLGIAGAAPNPFNPRTTIHLELPRETDVTLQIYDLRGRLVRTLWQGSLAAGRHPLVWDGRSAVGVPQASGVYFARMSPAETGSGIVKLLLVK